MAGSDWIWNITTAEANLRRHGVSFQLAARVFQDPMSLSVGDPAAVDNVWWTLGAPDLSRPEIVLLVRSEGAASGERGRIAGARRATPTECEAYRRCRAEVEGRHGAAV